MTTTNEGPDYLEHTDNANPETVRRIQAEIDRANAEELAEAKQREAHRALDAAIDGVIDAGIDAATPERLRKMVRDRDHSITQLARDLDAERKRVAAVRDRMIAADRLEDVASAIGNALDRLRVLSQVIERKHSGATRYIEMPSGAELLIMEIDDSLMRASQAMEAIDRANEAGAMEQRQQQAVEECAEGGYVLEDGIQPEIRVVGTMEEARHRAFQLLATDRPYQHLGEVEIYEASAFDEAQRTEEGVTEPLETWTAADGVSVYLPSSRACSRHGSGPRRGRGCSRSSAPARRAPVLTSRTTTPCRRRPSARRSRSTSPRTSCATATGPTCGGRPATPRRCRRSCATPTSAPRSGST